MTSSSNVVSGSDYGNGTYEITTSDNKTWDSVYNIVDGNEVYGIGGLKIGIAGVYSTTDGYYTGTTSTTDTQGTLHKGEWIQFQFPTSIYLYEIYLFRLWSKTQAYNVVILGSTNGSTWDMMTEQTSLSYATIQTTPSYIYRSVLLVDSSVSYSYYRLVITRVGVVWSSGYSGDNYVSLAEAQFYGRYS